MFSPPPSSSTSSSSTLTTTKLKTLLHNLILSRISRFFSKLKSAISHAMEDIHLSHYFTSSSDQLDHITKNNNYKSHIKKKILYGSFRLHYNWCSSKSNNSHILPPLNYTTGAAHDNISSTITSHFMDEFGKSSRRSKNSWGSTSSQRICHDYCNSNSSSFTDYRSCDESFQIPSKRLEEDGDSNNTTTTTTKVVDNDDVVFGEQQLSNYLQWLEENHHHQGRERKNYTSSSSTPLQQEKDALKMMNQIDKLADMFIADCHEKFRLEKIESYRRQISKNIISSYSTTN